MRTPPVSRWGERFLTLIGEALKSEGLVEKMTEERWYTLEVRVLRQGESLFFDGACLAENRRSWNE